MRDIIEKKAKVVASFLEEHNCKDVVIVPLEEGAFTASVRACDGNLLSFQQLQAEGMAHGKLGDGAYPIVYPDYTLLSH